MRKDAPGIGVGLSSANGGQDRHLFADLL